MKEKVGVYPMMGQSDVIQQYLFHLLNYLVDLEDLDQFHTIIYQLFPSLLVCSTGQYEALKNIYTGIFLKKSDSLEMSLRQDLSIFKYHCFQNTVLSHGNVESSENVHLIPFYVKKLAKILGFKEEIQDENPRLEYDYFNGSEWDVLYEFATKWFSEESLIKWVLSQQAPIHYTKFVWFIFSGETELNEEDWSGLYTANPLQDLNAELTAKGAELLLSKIRVLKEVSGLSKAQERFL